MSITSRSYRSRNSSSDNLRGCPDRACRARGRADDERAQHLPATIGRLIHGTDKGTRHDLRDVGDSLRMIQAQIAELFGRDVSVISRRIGNVLEEGELEEATSLHEVQTSTGRPATV